MAAGIIDPTAGTGRPATAAQTERPGVPSLKGLRVGLMENTKRNAASILEAVGAALVEDYDVGTLVRRTKPQFAMPLTEAQLEDLQAECDVVVVGVGDCGSCSASAVADGIVLERMGLPAAVICTDVFEETSRTMAGIQGDPGFRFICTEHPVANLGPAQIESRAGALAALVADRLLGQKVPAGVGP